MSKKSKRQVSKRMVAPFSPRGGGPEFNPDYTHVKRDLMRIGILAGSFFVLLIVLSFFLK